MPNTMPPVPPPKLSSHSSKPSQARRGYPVCPVRVSMPPSLSGKPGALRQVSWPLCHIVVWLLPERPPTCISEMYSGLVLLGCGSLMCSLRNTSCSSGTVPRTAPLLRPDISRIVDLERTHSLAYPLQRVIVIRY